MGNHCAKGECQEETNSTINRATETSEQREAVESSEGQNTATLEELRRQRLRLSLDIQGEQLSSLKEAKSSKIPPHFERDLEKLKTVPSSLSRVGEATKSRRVPKATREESRLSLNESTTQSKFYDESVSSSGAFGNTSNRTHNTTLGSGCKLQISYGACSLAGWEPVREIRSGEQQRKENQDSFYIEVPFNNRQDEAFFAVFDGHGANGRVVAEFVRDQLPVQIKESLKILQDETQLCSYQEDSYQKTEHFTATDEVLSCAYSELLESISFFNLVRSIHSGFFNCSRMLVSLNDKVDISMSGTTAVVAWFKGAFLFCCNVGDSRCIIGRQKLPRKYNYLSIDMTYDHKPSRMDEADRIQRSGGRIEYWDNGAGPLRVWLAEDWLPGLAMTRSFGDLIVESVGVVSEPEVTCVRLTSSDRFCILASDGVWEFMSSREVVNWIGKLRDKCSAQLAAEMVVEEAVRRWRKEDEVVDDTTAIVLWLDYTEEMTNPTIVESGVSDSRKFIKKGSSAQDNDLPLQNSVKYLWRFFSSEYRKNDIGSIGYAPITVTDKYVLKPFSCQNGN
ncbi:hypothetical protein GpartN1_g1219.t1 [Galdieria partita]|uniref:PPM-type phosphatase domain-containing protein n=1 Tax=Galdieria partita TaxID=83374 RepID=A0A9C7UN48_9RHOD|nr:hypothetical protein GpartN1_g1219.t1 [Galdieria partita]